LANVRLHAGALSDVQVEQHGGRTDKYGQFVFAVDEARVDPDELFDQAQSAEQVGDAAEAERLYRILMKSDPTDASAPFNLGNMLRVCARTVEAEAALRAATRANPAFAEAWYNLATYWTIKVVPKPLSNACARRSRSPPTSPMRCLTWHYCCNERAPTPKLPDYTIRTDLDAVTNARTVCDARHRINRHILPDPTDLLLDYRRCASCGRPSAA